jgi:tRNA1(Val) A37 N6-methylase TrmN6
MSIIFAPLHKRLVFNTPLSNERSAELVTFLTRYARGSIVDVGCGWAELLMRVLEANEAVHCVGIDLCAADFEHAKSVAEERGIAGRLEMICGDVKDRLPESAQGAICIGASQI